MNRTLFLINNLTIDLYLIIKYIDIIIKFTKNYTSAHKTTHRKLSTHLQELLKFTFKTQKENNTENTYI